MILKSFLPLVTKSHVEQRVLATRPAHLFNIICDVDAYAQFLPLCSHSKVLSRSTDGRSFRATLTVGIPPLLVETYVSHVTVNPQRWTVESKSVESQVLESLRSRWQLHDVSRSSSSSLSAGRGGDEAEPACRVDFWVEMSVRDPVMASALDSLLRQVAHRQVDAFAVRCRSIPESTAGGDCATDDAVRRLPQQ